MDIRSKGFFYLLVLDLMGGGAFESSIILKPVAKVFEFHRALLRKYS